VKLLVKFVLAAVLSIGALAGGGTASAGEVPAADLASLPCEPGWVLLANGNCIPNRCPDDLILDIMTGDCVAPMCHNWKRMCPPSDGLDDKRAAGSSDDHLSEPGPS